MTVVRRFWLALLIAEAALVTGFAVWASSADYFVRMPPSVRQGDSVLWVVGTRAAWLAVACVIFDIGVAAWIGGVRRIKENHRGEAVTLFVGAAVATGGAAWLLLLFVIFGFAQY